MQTYLGNKGPTVGAEEPPRPGNRSRPVVIIGGGGAGLAAALAAAEKGSSVVVVEKRKALGGNTTMAAVMFGAETSFQKRRSLDISRDSSFRTAMDYAHWRIDPKIVRNFIDETAAMTEWLEAKGVEFEDIPNYFPTQNPRVFQFVKGKGAALTKALARHCRARGVQFLMETTALRLAKNGKREVTGVVVANRDGNLTIPCRSVIIATGGYAGNREMMKKHCPAYSDDIILFGMPINFGDGLRMATGAGAATEGLGMLQTIGPRFAHSAYVAAVVVEPNTLWVNKRGERFVDESLAFRWPEAANALARQPDKICYSLFDESIKRIFMEEGVTRGFMAYPTGTKMTDLSGELEKHTGSGEIMISSSVGDIARWMGTDAAALKATVADYNAACAVGYDRPFLKDPRYLVPLSTPPYYAIKCHQSFHGTVGGIKINHRMEVVDKTGDAIPGLFAAGSDTGGWEGDTYCLELSGSTLSFAITSGRIAGANAAAYAPAE
jgi:fumarate reductase flavoprotein subunit